MGGGEALDELTGDADDALRGPEPRHLLGFLERGGAVVDDRIDVRHRAGLHVGQALALPPDAANRAHAALVDLEDEGLDELGSDIQSGAGSEGHSSSRPQILRQNATAAPVSVGYFPAALSVSAIAAMADGIPSRRVPMP